ncbi:helix-turn-helix domain-containing protein [Streptomyces sp. NPDC050388]|uniref:helix-turn-helix domain-containing protein n=1 Tax=Streptomyces sp. NPDC050388 TaxID=3155781 RepID=UPI003440EB18
METLGIDTRMQPVYRALLEHGASGASELAARVGQEETTVRTALGRLAALSLVRRRPGDRHTWYAVAPELGLGALLAHQEAELDRRRREVDESRAAMMSLLAAHRPHRSSGDTGVTRLEGPEEIRLALDRLCRRATDEIVCALPGEAHVPHLLQGGHGALEAAPARGVRIRVLHLAAARNSAHRLHSRLTDAGAEVRTAATVTVAVTVVDRAAAVVPAPCSDAPGTTPLAELVTSPALVAALYALFEHEWEAALPAGTPAQRRDDGLNDQERTLLELLREGLTDEMAARRLGVSLRTVRRTMAGLLNRHGVRSRFQIGVVTGERGWLRDPGNGPRPLSDPASGQRPACDELAARRTA